MDIKKTQKPKENSHEYNIRRKKEGGYEVTVIHKTLVRLQCDNNLLLPSTIRMAEAVDSLLEQLMEEPVNRAGMLIEKFIEGFNPEKEETKGETNES